MSYETLGLRRAIMEEACKDLDMKFVFDDYDKHQYKRLSLLRHHARKANLQVAKVSGYNVYTLITNDGLAMTFDNLDDAFDFCHRYHLVKQNFLD